MNKGKHGIFTAAMVVLSCLPVLYLWVLWNRIPMLIPFHFDAQLKPEWWGPRSWLWFWVPFISVITILLFFMMKKKVFIRANRKILMPYRGIFICALLVLLISSINFIFIKAASAGPRVLEFSVFPILGLLLITMGVYRYSYPSSPSVNRWLYAKKQTNFLTGKAKRLSGILLVASGIITFIVSLLLPSVAFFYYLISTILIILVVPYFFKKMSKKSARL